MRGNSINCANDPRNESNPLCAKELPPQTGAVLARVRAGLEKVEAAELERLYDRLPELDQHSRGEIRKFADRIVAGFLFPPQNSLRAEASNGSDGALLHALQRLFPLSD